MRLYCSHCGSQNHASYDCVHQDRTFIPPPEWAEESKPVAVESKPVVIPKLVPAAYLGWPQVCGLEWLSAFDDASDLVAYKERYCPSVKLSKVWQCEHCSKWHFKAEPPSPSGDSSGSGGRSSLPSGFVPFRRRIRPSAFPVGGGDLPTRDVKPPDVSGTAPTTSPKPAIKAKQPPKPPATPRRKSESEKGQGGLW